MPTITSWGWTLIWTPRSSRPRRRPSRSCSGTRACRPPTPIPWRALPSTTSSAKRSTRCRWCTARYPRRSSPASAPLSVREARQRGERGGEAHAFARRERLAQEKKTEQGRDHESHLRDRDHDARLRARHAFDHASEGKGENDRRPGRVAKRGAGRPDAAIHDADENGGERDDDSRLRDDQRTRACAGTQTQGVDEVARPDGHGGDEHARERGPALAPAGGVSGIRRAEQQPDRGEREQEARDLVRRERLP